MSAQPDSFPNPGEVFEGRYQVEKLLGAGGFSRVYLATQTDLGRPVALKVMLPEKKLTTVEGQQSTSSSMNLAERFLQEARVVSKLRGPYTVTVHDHGRTPSGHLFMVLEYVDGEPLSAVVKREGALAPKRVAHILRQTLESLAEAHAHGLLHRDIKPANIMVYEHLGKPDNVKVLDFGIAKVVGNNVNQEDLTQSGSLLGTPRYMSPEQLRGDKIGPASDIYSLGLVAYEMLVGNKAIDSNSSVVIIGAQLDSRSFAVPNQPHIPPKLRMIVNRMLSKNLAERYPSANAVLEDLDNLTSGNFPQVQVPARNPMFTPIDDFPDISDSIEVLRVPEETAPREGSKGPSQRTLLIGIGVLAAVVILFLAVNALRKPAPAPSAVDPVSTAPAVPPVDEPAEPKPAEAKPEPPAIAKMLVATIPSNADVFVNGAPHGKSPLLLETKDLAPPVNLRFVVEGGGERLMVLDAFTERLDVDLTPLVAAKEPLPAEKPTPTDKPRPKPVKPKPDPKPADDKPADNNFVIPALDL